MSDPTYSGSRSAPSETAEPLTVEDELRARVRQEEAAGRLGLSALAGAELRELMEEAVGVVAEVLSVEYCGILELLPDETGLLLRVGVGWKAGLIGRATVGTGLESQAGYTLMCRGPVVVDDLREEVRFDEPSLLHEHGVVSGVSASIRAGGCAYGVLGAHTSKRRAFTEDEVSFLGEVADVLGAAIERKRAERDTKSLLGERTEWAAAAERRFDFLARANAMLSTSTDLPTVLGTAARLAVPALADRCFVDVVDETRSGIARFEVGHTGTDEEALAPGPQRRYPLEPGAPHGTPMVLRTGRPELIPEAEEAVLRETTRGAELSQLLHPLSPVSYMCVPLRVGGRTLGAMGFFSRSGRYGEEDLALAEGLAHSAALAIDNARHHVPEVSLVRELVRRAGQEEKAVPAAKHKDAPSLTPRQAEVLKLLAAGKSPKEIGRELYLSEATVRNHIRGLLKAFGAHSQLEVLARAREAGVLP